MRLRRKVDEKVLEWVKNPNGKVLTLCGPPHVGKSFLADDITREYDVVLRFNLADCSRTSLALIQAASKNYKQFNVLISQYYDVDPENKLRRIIFFERIDALDIAMSAIRNITEATDMFDIVATSELLLESNEKYHVITVLPLDFQEFMWATNNYELDNVIENCFNRLEVYGDSLNERVQKIFDSYLTVGGMPEAVTTFVEYKDLKLVEQVREKIIKSFSFTKKMKHMHDSFITNISRYERRYILSSVADNARFREFQPTIEFFKKHSFINYVYLSQINDKKISNRKEFFKAFYYDTGLLRTLARMYKIEIDEMGYVFNYIAQTLHSMGKVSYFYDFVTSDVDFVIEFRNKLFPIDTNTQHKYHFNPVYRFIENFVNVEQDDFNGLVLGNSNFYLKDHLIVGPYYLLAYLKE